MGLYPEIQAVFDGDSDGCIVCADCRQALLHIPSDSIDAIVTDPPAGIAFMGKAWDKDKGGRDQWVGWMTDIAAKCLRVLKPGGHALVWAIPRTSHWTATAWEDAGFEVRDRVSHLFGTGFPKSLYVGKAIDKAARAKREVVGNRPYTMPKADNTMPEKSYGISGGKLANGTTAERIVPTITAPVTESAKQWDGWGTALKPACEDWWLLRKPLSEKSIAANVLKWGTGGISIDACRVGENPGYKYRADANGTIFHGQQGKRIRQTAEKKGAEFVESSKGRWPANVTHDGSEEVLAGFPNTGVSAGGRSGHTAAYGGGYRREYYGDEKPGFGDSGSAARFFYCAKASKSDRGADNKHPTVKSTKLMEWLITLITTPGGIVLDCFAGSGSTLVAAKRLGFSFIGIEQLEEYCQIAQTRVTNTKIPKVSFF